MTTHPARPAGYRPFVAASDLIGELEAIQNTLDGCVARTDPGAPILDRIGAMEAWWQSAFDRQATTAEHYRSQGRSEHLSELTDLETLTADIFGPDVPLRDRVATLLADWQDYDRLSVALINADAMVRAMHARRGLA